MRLWSSKAATPHSVTRRQDLHFLCSGLPYRLSGFLAHSASFSAHKGAGPFPPYANQVHPERGLRTKTGRLIQLSSQEGLMTAQRRLLGLVGAGALALAFAAIGAAPAQGASNATVSILHGVPDATVDVYANGKALLENFEPGTLTDPQ